MHLNKKLAIVPTLFFFVFMHNVKAIYESSCGVAFKGNPKSLCSGANCLKTTGSYHFILQARLYYIDNKSFTQIGQTYFFSNTRTYNDFLGKVDNMIKIENFDKYGMDATSYQNGYKYLNNTYFKNATLAKDFLNKITNTDDYDEVLNKTNQTKGNNKGYRLVIEPALNYGNPTFIDSSREENSALYSVKGLASEINRLGQTAPKELIGANSRATWLFNDSVDVGVSAETRYSCEDLDVEQLADIRVGCGYKFIDISQYISTKSCYKEDGAVNKNNENIKDKPLECIKYDENNEETYTSKYSTVSCSGKSDSEKLKILKKYGKLTSGTNTCGIYCNETDEISFPGNVLNPVQQGSYFAWPTRYDDATGKYRMSIKSTLTCHAVGTETSVVASIFERNCPVGYTQYKNKEYDICRKETNTAKVCLSNGEYPIEYNGRCRSKTDKPKICPSTHSITYNTTLCRDNNERAKECPSTHPTVVNANVCRNETKQLSGCQIAGKVNIDGNVCARINNNPSRETVSTGTKVTDACPDGYVKTGQGGDRACKGTTTGFKCEDGWTETGSGVWDTLCKKCTTSGGYYYCSQGTRNNKVCTIYGRVYTIESKCHLFSSVSAGGYRWTISSSQKQWSCSGAYGIDYNQGCCSAYRTKNAEWVGETTTCSYEGMISYTKEDYKPYKDAYCTNGRDPDTNCKCSKGYKYVEKDGDGRTVNICVQKDNCTYYYAKGTKHGNVDLSEKCWYDGDNKFKACPAGTIAISAKGVCYNSKNKVCPSGTVEVSGKCYRTANKVCPNNTVEIGGKCYPVQNKVCDTTVRTGKCYQESAGKSGELVTREYTNDRKCPDGYSYEKNGKCYKTISDVCPKGYTYIDGSCFLKEKPNYSDKLLKINCTGENKIYFDNYCYTVTPAKTTKTRTVVDYNKSKSKSCSGYLNNGKCYKYRTSTCKQCYSNAVMSGGTCYLASGGSIKIVIEKCAQGTFTQKCPGHNFDTGNLGMTGQGCCIMSCWKYGYTYSGSGSWYCPDGYPNEENGTCYANKEEEYKVDPYCDSNTINFINETNAHWDAEGNNIVSKLKGKCIGKGDNPCPNGKLVKITEDGKVKSRCEIECDSKVVETVNGVKKCVRCPNILAEGTKDAYHSLTEGNHNDPDGKKTVDLKGTCTRDKQPLSCDKKKIVDKMCREEHAKDACPDSHPYKDGNKCYRILNASEHYCKTGTYVKKNDTCVICDKGVPTSDGLCRYSYTCSLPTTVQIGDKCYETTNKLNKWYCPANYKLDGTTCINNCSKETLANSVESLLKNGASAKLIGGTNRKIDDALSTTTTVTSDKTKLVFTQLTTFKIKNTINRYYNKETGEVSDTASNWNSKNVFDRKEGVISLGMNDIVVESGTIKKYLLELSDIKFGIVENYGQYIKNYKCSYKTTTTTPCRCPSGTDFAGVSVYELLNNICNLSDSNGTYKCVDLQNKLCQKPDKYYCKNLKNNSDVEITSCVQQKINDGKKAYVAFTECRNENSECSKTCNEACLGDCVETNRTSNNVIINIKKCNGKTCTITPYCKEDKNVSPSSLDCLAEQLNLKNVEEIKKALDNKTISLGKIDNAAKACSSTICGEQKIIFRTIDLNDPFYGNSVSGFSLTDNKSRKPGANWYSVDVVKNSILKARNVEGNKLYNKTPLYTITLTPNDIKKIREYNKKYDYSSFDMVCNNSSKTFGCISEFIHGDTESLKSMKISVTGVSRCTSINLSTSTTNYKKCYYSNN